MKPEYFLNITSRYGETGATGIIRLAVLADWLQEAATINAQNLHFGEEAMQSYGLTWVLVRQKLALHRVPRAGETVRVRTWPSHYTRFGHRGYEILDATGTCLVQAVSAWAVMDLQTRKMVALPQAILQHYPTDLYPCAPFSCKTLPRVSDIQHQFALRVRHDDLDSNGHVNNAHYLSWLTECLPDAERSSLTMLDLAFRAETFPAEELLSLCGQAERTPTGWQRAHAIRRPQGEDVCRALLTWQAAAPQRAL
jgi:medium-chain acyl-[acyl-carrier-protein] hydrolase